MFERFADDNCTEKYPETQFATRLFSQELKVFAANYARLLIDVATCPQPGSSFVAGEPFEVQPRLTGVVDENDTPAITLGNQANALIFMKALGREFGGCLGDGLAETDETDCLGFEGYPADGAEVLFDPDEGFVQFQRLAALRSNGGNANLDFLDRQMFLRFYVRGWKCIGATCGYIGPITYSDCPNGFYVTAGDVSRVDIQVQPGDSSAGNGLGRYPVIALTDSYGNRKPDIQQNESWSVDIHLRVPNVPATPSTRLNRQRKAADIINMTIRADGTDEIDFAHPDRRELIIIEQAAAGYALEFKLLVEPPFKISSLAFEVTPCAVSNLTMVHSDLMVGAGDSICGAAGSAWEELAHVQHVYRHCVCTFDDVAAGYTFNSPTEENECVNVCEGVLNGANGTTSDILITGNPRDGVRSWVQDFYVGSTLAFVPDISCTGTVQKLYAQTDRVVVVWSGDCGETDDSAWSQALKQELRPG
ncbi:MAG: hypothetical protein ACPIOQ_39405, partial [Promethearchaeia archaeon]